MKAYKHPTKDEITLSGVLHALSDPVRLSVVNCLAGSSCERPCSSFDVPVHKSTMSHHLRVLRESGLVYVRGEGTFNYLSLRRDVLEERFPNLLASVLAAAHHER